RRWWWLRPQFRDEPQNLLEHLPCDGDLGHLEDNIAAVAHDFRADLDQLNGEECRGSGTAENDVNAASGGGHGAQNNEVRTDARAKRPRARLWQRARLSGAAPYRLGGPNHSAHSKAFKFFSDDYRVYQDAVGVIRRGCGLCRGLCNARVLGLVRN